MQQSMTGFCRMTEVFANKQLVVDIKSLNSKSLDLNVKIPSFYKELEYDIRQIISKELIRGKIDVLLSIEWLELPLTASINHQAVQLYFKQLLALKEELNLEHYQPDWFASLLRLPEVIQTAHNELSDEEKAAVLSLIERATQEVVSFRNAEGKALMKDILHRVEKIEQVVSKIEPFEEQRIKQLKDRIFKHLNENLGEEKLDKNRLEQEWIYYIEKLDITEEKVRIRSHCRYFKEVSANEKDAGRKLSFIAQELGREINTLGSKAQDFNIQRLVVIMKDELEKIKEQLLNIL